MNNQPSNDIRVVIVDNDDSILESQRILINGSKGFQVIGTFSDPGKALRAIPRLRPDVILLEYHLHGMNGVECARQIFRTFPEAKILMVTFEERPAVVFEALKAGCLGYLVKTQQPARILEAIAELYRGFTPLSPQVVRHLVMHFRDSTAMTSFVEIPDHRLTPREKEIMDKVAQGFRSKDIARELSLSVLTVNSHLHHIYSKLEVNSRTAAVAKYLKLR